MSWIPALRRSVLPDLALAAVAAYAAIRLLGASINRLAADAGVPTHGVLDDPVGFGLVWVLVSLAMIVTRQRWVTLALVLGVAVVGHVAQREKLDALGVPLLPTDLAFVTSPEFLASQTDTATVVVPLVGAVVVAATAAWLDHRRRRHLAGAPDVVRRRRRLVSLAFAPVLALTTAVALDFNRPHNPIRAMYDTDSIECCAWGQFENYVRNGFVAGFLTNVPSLVMEPPEGYSQERIAEIAARYAQDRPDPDGITLADLDVVVVLSESVADPTRLTGLTIERDPLPHLRQRGEEGWSGQTVASYYGTGTSTMEFQVLTGQSIGLVEPQIFSPYQSIIAGQRAFPSAVGWLSSQGAEAVAVHPYSGALYQRRSVYEALGFSEFREQRDFTATVPLGRNPHVSDADAFAETLTVLDTATSPTLVNLVTMQNHTPFFGWYDDVPQVAGLVGDDEEQAQLQTWLRGLEHSDVALDEFLAALSARSRPTVVVYYGDHYPPALPAELREENEPVGTLLTPVLLWSNVDVLDPGRDLGIVDATTLLPLAAEMVGAPLPPYYRLVQHVQDVVGSVGRGLVVTPDGDVLEESDLTPEQRQVLEDYRMVQYDFSVGRGYGIGPLWYDWAP